MEPEVINLVTSWPQALVAIVLILVLLVWPGLMSWLQARRSAITIDAVKETLDSPDSGTSVKDALNRIEGRQKTHTTLLDEHTETLLDMDARVEHLEKYTARPYQRWRGLFSTRR